MSSFEILSEYSLNSAIQRNHFSPQSTMERPEQSVKFVQS